MIKNLCSILALDFLHNFFYVPVCVRVPVPELRWFRKSINRARARIRARKLGCARGLINHFNKV